MWHILECPENAETCLNEDTATKCKTGYYLEGGMCKKRKYTHKVSISQNYQIKILNSYKISVP